MPDQAHVHYTDSGSYRHGHFRGEVAHDHGAFPISDVGLSRVLSAVEGGTDYAPRLRREVWATIQTTLNNANPTIR